MFERQWYHRSVFVLHFLSNVPHTENALLRANLSVPPTDFVKFLSFQQFDFQMMKATAVCIVITVIVNKKGAVHLNSQLFIGIMYRSLIPFVTSKCSACCNHSPFEVNQEFYQYILKQPYYFVDHIQRTKSPLYLYMLSILG